MSKRGALLSSACARMEQRRAVVSSARMKNAVQNCFISSTHVAGRTLHNGHSTRPCWKCCTRQVAWNSCPLSQGVRYRKFVDKSDRHMAQVPFTSGIRTRVKFGRCMFACLWWALPCFFASVQQKRDRSNGLNCSDWLCSLLSLHHEDCFKRTRSKSGEGRL